MYSDVNRRYPDFKDFTKTMRREIADGGLYGVDDDVYDLVTNCVPVGLDEGGEVILPDGYQTTDGPAVLIVQPDDKRLFWRKALEHQVALGGYETFAFENDDSYFEVPLARRDNAAFVWIEDVLEPTEDGDNARFIPMVMVVETWYTDPTIGLRVFAHESDHWDMANHFQVPADEFNPFTYYCDTEKRAYNTELQIVVNQFGGKQIITTVKRALGYLEQLPFNYAVEGLDDEIAMLSMSRKSIAPVMTALAISCGDGTDRASADEQSFYSALGVVDLAPIDSPLI